MGKCFNYHLHSSVCEGTSEVSLKSECPRFDPSLYNLICHSDGLDLMVSNLPDSNIWFPCIVFKSKFRSRIFPWETKLFLPWVAFFANSCFNISVPNPKIEWSILLFICEIRPYEAIIQHKGSWGTCLLTLRQTSPWEGTPNFLRKNRDLGNRCCFLPTNEQIHQ